MSHFAILYLAFSIFRVVAILVHDTHLSYLATNKPVEEKEQNNANT